jgi:hypothetical protein
MAETKKGQNDLVGERIVLTPFLRPQITNIVDTQPPEWAYLEGTAIPFGQKHSGGN